MNGIMENIKTMLLEDSHRWQCPDYCAVVIVPKKYLKATSLELLNFTYGGSGYKHRLKELTLQTGGRILLRTHETSERSFMDQHCGMQYTSVLMTLDDSTEFERNYTMSRLRNVGGEHPVKFVMM